MKSVASGTSTDLNHIEWVDVSKSIDGRSGKQCRERYMNHLNPALQKGTPMIVQIIKLTCIDHLLY